MIAGVCFNNWDNCLIKDGDHDDLDGGWVAAGRVQSTGLWPPPLHPCQLLSVTALFADQPTYSRGANIWQAHPLIHSNCGSSHISYVDWLSSPRSPRMRGIFVNHQLISQSLMIFFAKKCLFQVEMFVKTPTRRKLVKLRRYYTSAHFGSLLKCVERTMLTWSTSAGQKDARDILAFTNAGSTRWYGPTRWSIFVRC